MDKDTQVLISLDDERAKYLSEVISNKSCKKILAHLSEKEGAVSEIAQELKMPINTVDYNVKKLIKAGLIEKRSHWWSSRGKKMPIYVVSDKKIIISPRKSGGVIKYFFALITTGIASLILRGVSTGSGGVGFNSLTKSSDVALTESVRVIENASDAISNGAMSAGSSATIAVGNGSGGAFMNSKDVALEISQPILNEASQVAARSSEIASTGFLGIEIWLWFLIGAWSTIFLFLLINIISERRLKID